MTTSTTQVPGLQRVRVAARPVAPPSPAEGQYGEIDYDGLGVTTAYSVSEAWLVPDFVDADGQFLMSIHILVVEAGGCRIVVDTCSANSKDVR